MLLFVIFLLSFFMSSPILRVAVPVPLRRLFDYLPPAALEEGAAQVFQPGLRLEVPFGKRRLVGVLVEVAERASVPRERLRRTLSVLDDKPLIPPDLVDLCVWVADYYQHAPGEVLAAALPPGLRLLRRKARLLTVCQLSAAGAQADPEALQRAPRQAALLAMLQAQGPLPVTQLRSAGFGASIRKGLTDKGLAEITETPTPLEEKDRPFTGNVQAFARGAAEKADMAIAPITLRTEQRAAVNEVLQALNSFQAFLLYGITGSGKTEVYLELIAEVLARGRQALVLVPEIGLTPQAAVRFAERFDVPIAILHSGLSEKQRLAAWLAAQRGEARIVIGTRSAVFTPLAAPGLLVVDEEHDASYKQQDGLRYSARDLAVVRARRHRIPVVLGSATPSLESLHNVERKRYRELCLLQRAGSSAPPVQRLLDMRGSRLRGGLSEILLDAIGMELGAGGQVLLFLNRRGYAPTLGCRDCGWMAGCPNCDAHLVLHSNPPRLHCHHCDFQRQVQVACPRCRSVHLDPTGHGTQRAEQVLREQFPDVPVHRIDRDAAKQGRALPKIFSEIQQGNPCILVGTQMLAKGHHFPQITLAAVLDADSGLFSPDFRAPERLAQLLVQVTGRAGRWHKPGVVWIQTRSPKHPFFSNLIEKGYRAFARSLLAERKQRQLPPACRMALLRVEAEHLETAMRCLASVRRQLEKAGTKRVLVTGPAAAPLVRRAGRCRALLAFYSPQLGPLHTLLHDLCLRLESARLPQGLRWSVDIDPQEIL